MAQDTFTELFNFGAIPIVNENDTVAVAVCRPLLREHKSDC